MYKYEYEKVNCELGGWGVISGNVYSIDDYKTIIDKRAKEGWRFVGYIPTKQRGTGHIQGLSILQTMFIAQYIYRLTKFEEV